MKQQSPDNNSGAAICSLQQLVESLVDNAQYAASHNRTHVINEVRQELGKKGIDPHAAMVIEEILRTVIGNSRNGEIHITADHFSDIVVVEIQERNNYNGYALAFSIGSIEPDAASLGGHISIKGQQQKITTISFSFPSTLLAA